MHFSSRRLSAAQRVIGIDVHTGLGRFGRDLLLVERKTMRSSAKPLGNASLFPNPGLARLIAFEAGLQHLVRNALPATDFRFMMQEFGTYNPIKVLHTLARGEPLASLRLGNSRSSHQTGVEKCLLPGEQKVAETRPCSRSGGGRTSLEDSCSIGMANCSESV